MDVLVTGGSGFVGRHLIAALLADGHRVLALARSPEAASAVAALGAEPVHGALGTGPLDLPRHDAVVHAAAHFRLAGPPAPFLAVNVEGTRALLAAARAAGARRFVHISAAAVVMDAAGRPLLEVDEAAPTFPDSPMPYIASKAQAEALVLAADAPGFATLALRPPAIWGPGDGFSHALPKLARRRLFGFVGGGDFPCVTCHVDNLVEAALCALRSPAHGRAFFVNDPEPTRFRAFVLGIGAALGLDLSRAPAFPYAIARGLGGLMQGLWAWTGARSDPPMSRTMVRLIGRPFTTSDAAARAALGYLGRRRRVEGLAAYAPALAGRP